MNIAIVKYNAGNIHSMYLALKRLGIEAVISDDPTALRRADRVIFPGVGEAKSAMSYLKQRGLDRLLPTLTQPFLGVCLGLQLLGSFSEENQTPCLGVFDFTVRKFPPGGKTPHMGWNSLQFEAHPLFAGLCQGDYVYFVHSYYAPVSEQTIARSDHLLPFSAALAKDNFFAVQFHPEKSGAVGEQILRNFLSL